MVGHEGDPASNSRSFFEDVSGQKTEDVSEDYSSSTFGTVEDQKYVRKVFENSKNFENQAEGYSAEGIEVSINEEGFEYEIGEDVEDEAAQEFVDGIVKSFEGGEGAIPRIFQEIEDRTKEPVTDGGYSTETMSDVDHESYGVQNVMDRGDEGEPDKMADGSGFNGIPIGGGPSYADTEPEEETNNMGDHPM